MADFDTGQALLRHVLRRAGQILPTATDETVADRLIDAKLYVTEAHWWLCGLRSWRWARKNPPAQFVSIAEDEVTVSTIAGATVTLSATITATRAGRKFLVDADGIPHRISAHTAGSAVLTLATAYTGEATSGAARIYQDELTVASDILGWPDIREVRTGAPLEVIGETELRALAPANSRSVTRNVRYAAFITDAILRIVPWTTEARLFECAYNVRASALTFDGVAATDTPLVPQTFRPAIAWRACVKIAEDRRDERRKEFQADLDEVVARMQAIEQSFARARQWVPPGHRISGR